MLSKKQIFWSALRLMIVFNAFKVQRLNSPTLSCTQLGTPPRTVISTDLGDMNFLWLNRASYLVTLIDEAPGHVKAFLTKINVEATEHLKRHVHCVERQSERLLTKMVLDRGKWKTAECRWIAKWVGMESLPYSSINSSCWADDWPPWEGSSDLSHSFWGIGRLLYGMSVHFVWCA